MVPSPSNAVDPAHLVCLSPCALNQLIVVTSGARLLKFSASTGQLLSEVLSCSDSIPYCVPIPIPKPQHSNYNTKVLSNYALYIGLLDSIFLTSLIPRYTDLKMYERYTGNETNFQCLN